MSRMPNVTKAEFRTLVFEFARAKQLRVDEIKDGKARIWFNENSQKFLHADHVDALYDRLRHAHLSPRDINIAIENVAPGRPCTHRGMREIYVQIHRSSLVEVFRAGRFAG
ncbi:hypothetical protein JAO10_30885 [Burkholderia contaminans]|uniref:Uncharacterized protein n=2 Tax=Burkholderia contaminans TaxID=488447 RepID=A0AAP4VM25_9BURK|nr:MULTISPECIES: hypothetical protein [Burkholderia]MBD1417067.1 hypothetical protein [Burkholderia contaminans]MBH9667799.1 hypothetical protein [Burkholderia contaminans]MBH9675161.1 hypothetical protein [Burkholderia contaminans]MBH9704835.1 hypothetical protein [Burkholderia contaminans]MBH9724742.1 hypothetical protein [Burkholderia contaminans]